MSPIGDPVDPIEAGLTRALELAAEAFEWGVVALLARELEARRRSRIAPDVVDLAEERAKQPRTR